MKFFSGMLTLRFPRFNLRKLMLLILALLLFGGGKLLNHVQSGHLILNLLHLSLWSVGSHISGLHNKSELNISVCGVNRMR